MTLPRQPLLSCAAVLLLVLTACGRHASETERAAASAVPLAPTASASASTTEISPAPSASAATQATLSTPAEDAAAALDASAMERLVFRELLVGGYTGNWRRTWILYRSEARARLDVLCQMGVEHVRLTGKENDESAWKEPSLLRYVGTREGQGTYRMALTNGIPNWPRWATRREVDLDAGLPPLDSKSGECSWVPETINLSCRLEPIAVLRAGAALIYDNASEGLFHWAPSAAERVAGLRCEGVTNGRFKWPVVFVAPRPSAPGIEWAFLHDDAVQQGSYRWMPAAK